MRTKTFIEDEIRRFTEMKKNESGPIGEMADGMIDLYSTLNTLVIKDVELSELQIKKIRKNLSIIERHQLSTDEYVRLIYSSDLSLFILATYLNSAASDMTRVRRGEITTI